MATETPSAVDDGCLTLTVDEAAKLLNIGRDHLYRLIHTADVPHLRLGRKIRLRRASLEAWLERQEQKTA